METTNFGSVLREARERRSLSLAEVARKTKVPQSSLQLIEAGRLEALPAEVYVRGFIRSYAKSVGVPESEPLGLYEQAMAARRRAEAAAAATPTIAALDGDAEDDLAPRRGIGLAVFVIIVLLIATITLTMFLRQPPQAGEGLSLAPASAETAAPDARAT